jgi:hypothetical protein
MKQGKLLRNFSIAVLMTLIVVFGFLILFSWFGKYPEYLESRLSKQKSATLLLDQRVCSDDRLKSELKMHKQCETAEYDKKANPYYLAMLDVADNMCSSNSKCERLVAAMMYNMYTVFFLSVALIGFGLYMGVLSFTQRCHDNKHAKTSLPGAYGGGGVHVHANKYD